MKKIIVFGASSSRNSINKKLATFAGLELENVAVEILDLNDFEMPIYSIDKEQENGIPELAKNFKNLVNNADGLIVSFAEHNGTLAAAFKNIYDWISRIEQGAWGNKPMFALATSPGARGGQSVLDHVLQSFPYRGAKIVANFSLPSFNDNFSAENGISDATLKTQFDVELKKFEEAIFNPETIEK